MITDEILKEYQRLNENVARAEKIMEEDIRRSLSETIYITQWKEAIKMKNIFMEKHPEIWDYIRRK